MSNLSIQPMLNPVSANAEARAGTERDAADRNDPALAFNEVMQRHGSREPSAQRNGNERTRTNEQGRPADRTPPAEGARPGGSPVKHDAPGAARPIARSEPAGPVDDGAGTPAPAVDNSPAATSGPLADPSAESVASAASMTDLFADIGTALAVAEKATAAVTDASGSTLTTLSAPDAEHALAGAAQPGAFALAPAPGTGVDTPVPYDAAIDSRHNATTLTRPGARAPRNVDAAAGPTAPAKPDASVQQLLPIEGGPHERAALETELTNFAATLDTRSAPAARTEPMSGAPLSLSAALSAGSGAMLGVAPPAPTFTIGHAQVATPVGAHGFNDELSQRVVMLAGQRVQSAEIALTPADLGPISVTMEVRGQEASLVFGAVQSATRSAIEDALPRLREMFQTHGLHLVDAHVGAQMGHHGRRDGQSPQAHGAPDARTAPIGEARADASAANTTVLARSYRLIDIRV